MEREVKLLILPQINLGYGGFRSLWLYGINWCPFLIIVLDLLCYIVSEPLAWAFYASLLISFAFLWPELLILLCVPVLHFRLYCFCCVWKL